MSRRNDHIEKLIAMLRWAHAEEEPVDTSDQFVESVSARTKAIKRTPLESIDEMIRWAHARAEVEIEESIETREAFISAVMRTIEAEDSPASKTFVEWFEHYADSAIRIGAPAAAAMACWLVIVGPYPDVELKTLFEVGIIR